MIRKGSLAIAACGWVATVLTALAVAFTASIPTGQRALAIEIVTVSVAVTASVIYVLAMLTAHIDDTQWAIGYSSRYLDSGADHEPTYVPAQGRRF